MLQHRSLRHLFAKALSRISPRRIVDELVKDIRKYAETPSEWMVGVLDRISEVLRGGLPASSCKKSRESALKRMRAFIVENLWKGKDTRVEKMATALEMGRVPTLDLDEDFDRCSPQIETSPGDGSLTWTQPRPSQCCQPSHRKCWSAKTTPHWLEKKPSQKPSQKPPPRLTKFALGRLPAPARDLTRDLTPVYPTRRYCTRAFWPAAQ
mmetsp:Transcript_1038/g.1385  ORF Transcript_1038/g.1385 Transcript_1038/m.1385 type:complete len:209 (-) Transcript_1038:152-778(-)